MITTDISAPSHASSESPESMNTIAATSVEAAKILLQPGMTATIEEPFGEKAAKVELGADGALPTFGMYALVTIRGGVRQ